MEFIRNGHQTVKSSRAGQQGFALLITIVLVAFLVLILVGLATTTRVETQVATNTRIQAMARQNALFGLNVALGQLQEAAGLDSRITATAGLLNPIAANRDWTGVWSVAPATGEVSSSEPIKWLVSGASDASASEAALNNDSSAIRIFTAGNTVSSGVYDRDVWVQRERIRAQGLPGFSASTAMTIGTYAFYVGDEGVKASLSALPLKDLNHEYYSAGTARDRTVQLGGRAPVGFLDVAAFDPFSTAVQANLARTLDSAQFKFLDPVRINNDKLRERRPDFTAGAFGLLVDPVEGRLKRDLSINPAAELGAALTPYVNAMAADRAQLIGGATTPISAPISAGDLNYVAAPIITQFNFQAAIANGPGEGSAASRATNPNLETRARFFLELWNPYTDTLTIPDGSDLRVLIRNLPEVVVETRANPAATPKDYGSATVNFGTVYNNTSEANVVALIFRPDDLVTLSGGEKAMISGRIYTAIHPSGYAGNPATELAKQTLTRVSTFARNTYWNRPSGALAGGVTPDADMEFRLISSEETNIVLTLQLGSGTSWVDLSTVNLPPFIPTETPWGKSTDRFPRIGFHVKMAERSSTGGGANWLVDTMDFRRPVFAQESFVYVIDDDPASYTSDVPDSASATERADLFNRVDSSSIRHHYDIALYELPRQEWISVGSLQHLAFQNGSGPDKNYALGNSWANGRNRWFDRYYFSTVPTGTPAGTVTDELANWRLRRVDAANSGSLPTDEEVRADPDENARHFMVADAFNINSTSVEAWRSVLGGLRMADWSYATRNGTTGEVVSSGTTTLESPFFRFSQSAAETWDVSGMSTSSNIDGIRRFYRQGARSLTQTQINALAEEIVARIRSTRSTRGPFASISEFLTPVTSGGENIFEQAIAATNIRAVAERINYDTTLATVIDPRSPSALSSADIMTALAPMVSSRSDTFVIRAYGAATDLFDSQASATSGDLPRALAEAWVEARVQRIPTTVSPTDNIVSPSPSGFGRQFKVVSFRWLTSSDL